MLNYCTAVNTWDSCNLLRNSSYLLRVICESLLRRAQLKYSSFLEIKKLFNVFRFNILYDWNILSIWKYISPLHTVSLIHRSTLYYIINIYIFITTVHKFIHNKLINKMNSFYNYELELKKNDWVKMYLQLYLTKTLL